MPTPPTNNMEECEFALSFLQSEHLQRNSLCDILRDPSRSRLTLTEAVRDSCPLRTHTAFKSDMTLRTQETRPLQLFDDCCTKL